MRSEQQSNTTLVEEEAFVVSIITEIRPVTVAQIHTGGETERPT
jgi:hypothetical protein